MSDDEERIVSCPYCGLPLSESECERLRPANPPAWVEKLAAEWEAESLRLGDRYELRYTDDAREEKLGQAYAYDACAEQLRERAKPG